MFQPFKRIDIKNIKVKGFKGYKEERYFNLFHLTKILAENGQGKTSLREAISWCFLGSNIWGNDREDSSLLNNSSKEMEVVLTFTNEENVEFVLFRNRKGNTTTILLNDKNIRQAELTALLGNKDIFLSIFNPEYYSAMTEKEARNFMISILPSIQIDDVAINLDDYELDLIKDELNLIHNNPNKYNEDRRKEIKEMEENLLYLEGKISGLELEQITEEKKAFDEKELKDIEKQINDLTLKKAVVDKTELENLISEKNNIEKKLISIESKEFKKPDTTEKFEKIKDLERNIALIEKEKFETNEDTLRKIYTLESEINTLREEYKEKRNIKIQVGDNCPSCKTLITEKQIINIGAEAKKELSKIALLGQEKQKKLEELQADIEKSKMSFETVKNNRLSPLKEQYKKYVDELNKMKNEYKISLDSFLKNKDKQISTLNKQLNSINEKISKLENNYKVQEESLNETNNLALNTLQEKATELRKQKAKIDAYNVELSLKKERYLKDIKEHEELLKEVDKSKSHIELCKNKISACNEYTAKKIEHLSDIMHSHLKDVTIELQKIIKSTGELKDSFELRYKNKPFKNISASEKIKTGLEIANLVINLTGFEFPIFIDNAESITKYNIASNVQVIEANVVKGQKLFVGSDEDWAKLEAKNALLDYLNTHYFSKIIANPESITEHDISSIIDIIKLRSVKKEGA